MTGFGMHILNYKKIGFLTSDGALEFTQMKRNWNLTDYYCPGVYLSPDIAVYTQLAEWMHVFILYNV